MANSNKKRFLSLLLIMNFLLSGIYMMCPETAKAENVSSDAFKLIDISDSKEVELNGYTIFAKTEYDYQAGQNKMDIYFTNEVESPSIGKHLVTSWIVEDYNIDLSGIITNGNTIYYVKNDMHEDDTSPLVAYSVCESHCDEYQNNSITELFAKQSLYLGLEGYYSNCLFYSDSQDIWNLHKYSISEKTDDIAIKDIGECEQHGRYFLCFPSEGEPSYLPISVYDAENDKIYKITDHVMGSGAIKYINGKLYYAEFIENSQGGSEYDSDTNKNMIQVIRCNMDGTDKEVILANHLVTGTVDDITEDYISCSYYENNQQMKYTIPYDQMSDEEYALYKANILSDTNGTAYSNISSISSLPMHDSCGSIIDDIGFWHTFLIGVYDSKLGIGVLEDPKTALEYPVKMTDIYYAAIVNVLKNSGTQTAVDAYNQVVGEMKSTETDIKGALDIIDTGLELNEMSQEDKIIVKDTIEKRLKKAFDSKTYTQVSGTVDSILKHASTVKDVLSETKNIWTLYLLKDSYKQVLTEMYNIAPTDDIYLREALDKAMTICDAPVMGGVYYGGQLTAEKAFDTYWDAFKGSVEKTYPELIAITAAADVGKSLGDIISNASDIINAEYESAAVSDITLNLETVYKHLIVEYLKNKNVDNAGKLNACFDMLRKAYGLNYDTALKFVNAKNDTWAHKIKVALVKDNSDIETATEVLTKEKDLVDGRFKTIESGFDSKKVTSFEKSIKYKYVIACPVTVKVNGKSYVSSTSMHSEDDVLMAIDGEKKIIYLKDGETADIRIEGNDSGKMNCEIVDVENNETINNYIGVPVDDSSEYSISSGENILKENAGSDTVSTNAKQAEVQVSNGRIVSGKAPFYENEDVEVEADIPYGYVFKGWRDSNGDSSIFADSSAVSTTITIPEGGVSAEAVLEREKTTYTISTESGEGGAFAQGSKLIVDEGDDCTLVAVPNDGYEVSDISVDGQSVGNQQNYILKSVSTDHIVKAIFSVKASNSGDNGNGNSSSGSSSGNSGNGSSGSSSGGSSTNPENPGTVYTITYNLNGGTATNPTSYTSQTTTFTLQNPTRSGYTFTGWTGSCGNTPQMSVSVIRGTTGNLNYIANWQIASGNSDSSGNGTTNSGNDDGNNSFENDTDNDAETDEDSSDQQIESISSKKSKITKLSSKKNSVTMRFKKVTVNGKKVKYQVAIKTPKAKKWKKTTLSSTKKNFKKLKKNQKYWVSVRPYIVVDGTRYYGKWAATKVIKTKK